MITMYGRKEPTCDNDMSMGRGIGIPQCYKGKVDWIVTVVYDEHDIDTDTLNLCDECTDKLQKDVKKYGYRLRKDKMVRGTVEKEEIEKRS